jgi:ribonuclease P protein subunit RPR2
LQGEQCRMDSTAKLIAKKRIRVLCEQAYATHKANPKLSCRYIETARRIAMAAKIRLPREYRRRICKRCNTLQAVGINSRVRTRSKREPHLVVTCLQCNSKSRIPFRKRQENPI